MVAIHWISYGFRFYRINLVVPQLRPKPLLGFCREYVPIINTSGTNHEAPASRLEFRELPNQEASSLVR